MTDRAARIMSIIKRDNYRCRHCNQKAGKLGVYQIWRTDTPPWQLPDSALVTLCFDCKATHHEPEIQISKLRHPERISIPMCRGSFAQHSIPSGDA